jgi:hypothetical protein
VIAILHLVLMSVAIYTRPQPSVGEGRLLGYRGYQDALRYVCEILVCLSCLFTVISEAIEIASQGIKTFLKNCVSYFCKQFIHVFLL